MGLMDIFRRKAPAMETRAVQPGYTAALMAAREAWISGSSGLAELTGAVQTSVSLWEAGLSLADVRGTDMLDRRTMAMTARALALRGECVFLIRDRLIPATDWDISTRYGQPRAYRVGLPEIGGGRNETALAGEVLHFRIGCDATAPWGWSSADLMAAELMAEVFRRVGAERPDWYEGQPEWTIKAGTLIARTRCVRCHGPLPEGHFKFCSRICNVSGRWPPLAA